MKKVLIKSILTLCISTVMILSSSFTSLAYTQDECGEEWKRLAEQYGINMDDYKTTGGLLKVVLLIIIWMVHSRIVLQQMIQLLYQKLNQKQLNQQKMKHQKKSQSTNISILLT